MKTPKTQLISKEEYKNTMKWLKALNNLKATLVAISF